MGKSNDVAPNLGSGSAAIAKREAHDANFRVWRAQTQRSSFNESEEYWTLILDKSESVEIQDLRESDIIRDLTNVHGVNQHQSVIDKCVLDYPGVHLYRGEWVDVINRRSPCPHGGLVYLDSQNQPDGKGGIASSSLVRTLEVCGPHTLVCANFCASSPRQGNIEIPHEKYMLNVKSKLTPFQHNRWRRIQTDLDVSGVYRDTYSPPMPNRTQMKTFFYWSEA